MPAWKMMQPSHNKGVKIDNTLSKDGWKEDEGEFMEGVGIKKRDYIRFSVEIKFFSWQEVQDEQWGKVSTDPAKGSAWGECGDVKRHKGKGVDDGKFI